MARVRNCVVWLEFNKITYFLADLQPHHFDVHVAAGVSSSLLDLLAQLLHLGAQLIVAGGADRLHPVGALRVGGGGEALLETVLEF